MDGRRHTWAFELRADPRARPRRPCSATEPHQSRRVSRRALGACAGMLIAATVSMLPLNDGEARETRASSSTSALAQRRDAALIHARTRIAGENHRALLGNPDDATGLLTRDPVSCRFIAHVPGGTTPKFECALE